MVYSQAIYMVDRRMLTAFPFFMMNEQSLLNSAMSRWANDLAAQGIAYVPFFPLGGFNPLQSSALDAAAAALQATPMQVALAWLLQRSPNILLIPGTSSVQHLRENLQAVTIEIPPEVLADLDSLNAR